MGNTLTDGIVRVIKPVFESGSLRISEIIEPVLALRQIDPTPPFDDIAASITSHSIASVVKSAVDVARRDLLSS